jgi:hypothetical protein
MNVIRYRNDGALLTVQDTMAGTKSLLDHGGVSVGRKVRKLYCSLGGRGLFSAAKNRVN